MRKLLIIEDDNNIRKIYYDVLGMEYEVFFASNGQEGFDTAQQNDFDLIITDLKMPVMDGSQMIEALYKVKPDLKYIIVSAYMGIESYQEKLAEIPTIVAYIPKPFKFSDLKLQVGNAFAANA